MGTLGLGRDTHGFGALQSLPWNSHVVWACQIADIRSRVNRHLTAARSDIVANRQVDVWEIAWVWAYPVKETLEIGPLEDALFHHFNKSSVLMTGKVPKKPAVSVEVLEPTQMLQVMSDREISEKKDPALRLPRQAEHYIQIVGHFLAVKNSKEIAGAIQAHFARLPNTTSSCLAWPPKLKVTLETIEQFNCPHRARSTKLVSWSSH